MDLNSLAQEGKRVFVRVRLAVDPAEARFGDGLGEKLARSMNTVITQRQSLLALPTDDTSVACAAESPQPVDSLRAEQLLGHWLASHGHALATSSNAAGRVIRLEIVRAARQQPGTPGMDPRAVTALVEMLRFVGSGTLDVVVIPSESPCARAWAHEAHAHDRHLINDGQVSEFLEGYEFYANSRAITSVINDLEYAYRAEQLPRDTYLLLLLWLGRGTIDAHAARPSLGEAIE